MEPAQGLHHRSHPSANGFLILRVEDHQKAGQAELSEVESQITEKLLAPKLNAAVREYLTKLRKDAFLEIKADYIDTGAAGGKDTAVGGSRRSSSPKQ